MLNCVVRDEGRVVGEAMEGAKGWLLIRVFSRRGPVVCSKNWELWKGSWAAVRDFGLRYCIRGKLCQYRTLLPLGTGKTGLGKLMIGPVGIDGQSEAPFSYSRTIETIPLIP